ncbi:MAG: NADP-dependent isocitrate dehydrogenase [Bacteroidetes bacterium]|nr:NADP-dependent isocitrate dehydrogenase [Bacteroidota bacterium]MDA1125553.1 NADP-dependent isocitrate dehydrogenase [Bacteroidota bacterium]
MAPTKEKIIYTYTDEAPALATHSFLPIVEAITRAAKVELELRDISLAARVLSQFPECVTPEQVVSDDLAELGELAKTPEANIIKLPNISASIPQLLATIKELQEAGFAIPDYPTIANSPEELDIKNRYDRVKGSAVNPVLREGNSDRRAPKAVKEYAQNNPHRMGEWSSDSNTSVATMTNDDFAHNEKSVTVLEDGNFRIEHVNEDMEVTVLKSRTPVQKGDILDGTFMSVKALRTFLREQIQAAKEQNVLFSIHMKATMMKVSDPIIFGHAVEVFFNEVFRDHSVLLDKINFNPNNGLGDLYNNLNKLSSSEQENLQEALEKALEHGPEVAMVDSDNGITNLHVPSDVIIDASMPAMIRTSGKMWDKNGETQDTLAVIPDSSYASVYHEVIEDCKRHGAFNPSTMGSVPNVGLMAQKAEEYGSHDKTFEIHQSGTVRVVTDDGQVMMEHQVEKGDIWRACLVKDAAIQNWVQLAVNRSKDSNTPAVFWLNEERAHDGQLINKVRTYLKKHDTTGLELSILSPSQATSYTLKRLRQGLDTISVTGNVLRDYLTDLFPILELGTSAKMLSIVPLMNGGGLFETGAGGSAPKHVQQFKKENYLRWDSLGEFLALAESLAHLAKTFSNERALILSESLHIANSTFLRENKSPTRKLGGIDNRGSHFYLAMYWIEELAKQKTDTALASMFANIHQELKEKEETIVSELIDVQGQKQDIKGYYFMEKSVLDVAMRPSSTFNSILDKIEIH